MPKQGNYSSPRRRYRAPAGDSPAARLSFQPTASTMAELEAAAARWGLTLAGAIHHAVRLGLSLDSFYPLNDADHTRHN